MADFERCCEILGINHDAGPDEIKQAYRDLVRIWHPDRFPGDTRLQQRAQEQLKTINAAYRKLIAGNPGRHQAGGAPDNAGSTRQTVEFHRMNRRFSIRRTAVCLFVIACIGFLLASDRRDLAEIPYNLGSAYLEAGHFDEALKAFRIAGWINPHSAKILYALGNAYYRSSRFAEAERAYTRVIRIDPHHEGALRGLALLSARRGTHELRCPMKRRTVSVVPPGGPSMLAGKNQ